ncbi:MAG: DUF4870 domain-containing protein [Candidatus Altiarchaeota archaeon]
MAETKATTKAGDDNLMAALAYFLAPLSSIVLYVVYKDKGNKFVLFHAVQATIFAVGLWIVMVGWMIVSTILSAVTGGILALCMLPISLVLLVGLFGAWIFLMYKAFKGEKYKLPMIGDMAEKYA